MEVFTDCNNIRTVFVKASIEGEQFHLGCIEYVFMDPEIQALGCTQEQVKKMLANIGFTPDRKAKPVHTISTLMDGCCMTITLTRVRLQQARGTVAKTPPPRTRVQSGRPGCLRPGCGLAVGITARP